MLPRMDDPRSKLLAALEAHCQATGLSEARVATIIMNDGKFFRGLRSGKTCTLASYERCMTYFAAHEAPKPSEAA